MVATFFLFKYNKFLGEVKTGTYSSPLDKIREIYFSSSKNLQSLELTELRLFNLIFFFGFQRNSF